MSRLRQRHNSFRTAELEYNKKRTALSKEYKKEMGKALKNNDIKYFTNLACDLVCTLGDSNMFSVFGLMELYKLDQEVKDQVVTAIENDGRTKKVA